MRTKTQVVEKPQARKVSRKTAKEEAPAADRTSSILFASALAEQAGKRKSSSTKLKTVRRIPAPAPEPEVPASVSVPEQIEAVTPKFGFLSRENPWLKVQAAAENERPTFLTRVVSWFRTRAAAPSHLRLAETVSLGEKRFVAIIHVEGRKFLIGGGTAGVSLLTQLDETA